MILDLILAPFKLLVLALIDLLPLLDFISAPGEMHGWIVDTISLVAWMLPIHHMLLIFGAWIFITYFHVTWQVLQRVWDALPFT